MARRYRADQFQCGRHCDVPPSSEKSFPMSQRPIKAALLQVHSIVGLTISLVLALIGFIAQTRARVAVRRSINEAWLAEAR